MVLINKIYEILRPLKDSILEYEHNDSVHHSLSDQAFITIAVIITFEVTKRITFGFFKLKVFTSEKNTLFNLYNCDQFFLAKLS